MRRYFGIAIASLAEVDAMTDTLGLLYMLDVSLVGKVLETRRQINADIFGMLKTRRR